VNTAQISVAAIAIAVLTGCGRTPPGAPHPALVPAPLNAVSASDLMSSVTEAGLPAPNAHDVTAVKCPKLHCLSAMDSDTVSILKFGATGPAQLYAAEISNAYQIEDTVLTFSPTVSPDLKQRYRRTVEGVLD
jgi:hypothetical protein